MSFSETFFHSFKHHGHNREILSACKPLGEYAWFIAQVRKNLAEAQNGDITKVSDAIDKAIEDMPKDFDIRKFIVANRAEVKDMCLTEYNETETMAMFKEEGRQEGLQESRLLDIKNLMDSTGWTVEKVMDLLKIPLMVHYSDRYFSASLSVRAYFFIIIFFTSASV